MQSLTLSVAALASFLVILLRPPCAFAVYVICLLFYPSYLPVTLGAFDVTAHRVVAGVLLVRCLASPPLTKKFKWSRLDTWVAATMVVSVGIPALTYYLPTNQVLVNRSGFLMDTFFAYLVARLCITDRRAMITAVKWIAVGLAPIALLGAVEASTGWQPYLGTMSYCPWSTGAIAINPRLGYFRAIGPFGHPIMFGAAFAMFLPLVYCLRHERDCWRPLAYVLSVGAIIGALSSMSSGPWMMIAMTAGCLMLEGSRGWLKPLSVLVVVSCIIVQIASNRDLHYVIVNFANPIGGTAWHRAMLIDLAIENFDEWWFCGYRGLDPGWGPALGMIRTDITNEYIIVGVRYGLLGVITLVGVLATTMHSLACLHRSVKDRVLKSWFWAVGSSIAVVTISFVSCSFFGQTLTVFYCLLGIVGSLVSFALAGQLSKKPIGVSNRPLAGVV